ncbi:MAG: hypothetical protein IPH54_21345 [Rhodoferax sp.]|nr:hypothetical protein [Rhodoferax sp.]
MIEEIRQAVHNAALGKQKIAMFHFQVLRNAAALEGSDPASFCAKLSPTLTKQADAAANVHLA